MNIFNFFPRGKKNNIINNDKEIPSGASLIEGKDLRNDIPEDGDPVFVYEINESNIEEDLKLIKKKEY